eukprot:COSAG02_NODE_2989_length_7609_cov_11.207723_6_plen_88_part_00
MQKCKDAAHSFGNRRDGTTTLVTRRLNAVFDPINRALVFEQVTVGAVDNRAGLGVEHSGVRSERFELFHAQIEVGDVPRFTIFRFQY